MKKLQKVHQYETRNQATTLIRVLPIKAFMQDGLMVQIQDGDFFFDGKHVEESEVPSWVFSKLQEMTLEQLEPLGMTRFSSEAQPEDDEGGFQQDEALVKALNKLDPEDDNHWTKKGKPSLNHLTEALGYKVTRKIVNSLMPHLERPEE